MDQSVFDFTLTTNKLWWDSDFSEEESIWSNWNKEQGFIIKAKSTIYKKLIKYGVVR